MAVVAKEEIQRHQIKMVMIVGVIRRKSVIEEVDIREEKEENVQPNGTYNASLVISTDTIFPNVDIMNHPRKARMTKQRTWHMMLMTHNQIL